ncbi:flavodoxin family protein [Helicobacter sp. 11S02629-2]|uniref:flavodoxin family protein n=1 Tax=Helicobacter sp. 11S02629-2 TaxID=1476195 RepID=UPI000BA512EF|nr:flavodoxin family protein [Helicobacter sp. 11S02629-2]PAF45679.1 hypothetical protein BKH40_02015 [Helicobacter sp. 11S02629-2]
MKNIVVYDSLTGNTKKLAEAIAKNLNCELKCVGDCEGESFENYKQIIFGFYIDKGFMGVDAERFTQKIRGKKVGIFYTLGGDPKSDRASALKERIKEFFKANDNEIVKVFYCQGAISDIQLEAARKRALAEGSPITPQREVFWKEGKKHPNDKDVQEAVAAFKDFK